MIDVRNVRSLRKGGAKDGVVKVNSCISMMALEENGRNDEKKGRKMGTFKS